MKKLLIGLVIAIAVAAGIALTFTGYVPTLPTLGDLQGYAATATIYVAQAVEWAKQNWQLVTAMATGFGTILAVFNTLYVKAKAKTQAAAAAEVLEVQKAASQYQQENLALTQQNQTLTNQISQLQAANTTVTALQNELVKAEQYSRQILAEKNELQRILKEKWMPEEKKVL